MLLVNLKKNTKKDKKNKMIHLIQIKRQSVWNILILQHKKSIVLQIH